jgi:hypothetical protein
MNYTELKQNIKDICENEFTDDALAMFTQQAEQKIYNTVQLATLRKNMTGSFASGVKYLTCPDDLLSIYSLAVIKANGEYLYLLNKDVNFIREAYPSPTSTGLPKHYAIFGPKVDSGVIDYNELSLIVGPTPNANYGAELHYYYYPTSIVVSGQTWLGEHFDSALLNGALIEAIRFMKVEVADIQNYEKLYLQAISLLKQLGDGKQRMDAYRDGQYRMPVT